LVFNNQIYIRKELYFSMGQSQRTTRRKGKNPNLSDCIPNKDRPVTNKQLEELLKQRMWTDAELSEIGVFGPQVQELKILGHKLIRQYEISKKSFVYYILKHGREPFTTLPWKEGQRELEVARMADIHIGSNEVNPEEVIMTLSYLWEAGYRIIYIAGDLTDGTDVYKGHRQNQSLHTSNQQADAFVEIFSMFDFDAIIACAGNHDQQPSREGGPSVIELIEEKMVSKGKNFTALKSTVGYIRTGNCLEVLIHMDGPRGNIQSETYSAQRMMDQRFKSVMVGIPVNGVRIFDEILQIVSVTAGHFHGVIELVYGVPIVVQPPGMQHTTDFIGRRGTDARPGVRVSKITLDEDMKRIVYYKGSLIFAENLEEMHRMEAQRSRNRRGPTIKSRKPTKTKYPKNLEIDKDKIERAIKKLRTAKNLPFDTLGLTLDEIAYINATYNYNIFVSNGTVVWKTDTIDSHIIHSPEPQSGIVQYMICSNGLIGSQFFDEAAFRFILDRAKEQGIKHVRFGGDMLWGQPPRNQSQYTIMFDPMEQIETFANILADYPEIHYSSINGFREQSLIESKEEEKRINPMIEVSRILAERGIKFTAINSNKCDFIINGLAFRDINLHRKTKIPYTLDNDVMVAQRRQLSKFGNKVIIDGVEYPIGVIFYGSIPHTYETYSGGIYIETTGGPSHDLHNASDLVQSNCEGKILTAYMKDGRIVKLESEIIFPPLNTIALPR